MSNYEKSNPVGYWNDSIADTTDTRAGATAPSFAALIGGIFCNSFIGGRTDTIFNTLQLSHGILHGSLLSPHIHFLPSINIPIGATVKWELEFVIIPIHGSMPGVTTILPGTYVNAVAITPAFSHLLVEFHPDQAAPVPVPESAIIVERLSRISSGGGADTFAGNAFLIGIDWHYQTNWPGGSLAEIP